MEIRPVTGLEPRVAPSTPPAAVVGDRFVPSEPQPALIPKPLVQVNPAGSEAEVREAAEALIVSGAAHRDGLVRDLSALPLGMLRLLKSQGVRVALLRKGESLADTSLLRPLPPERYRVHLAVAKNVLDKVVAEEVAVTEAELRALGPADSLHKDMLHYWEGKRIADRLGPEFRQANVGFGVLATTEPVDLDTLAAEQKVPAERRATWEEALHAVNGEHVRFEGGLAAPRHRVLVLPHTYHGDTPVAKPVLDSLRRIDTEHVQKSLGLHLPEHRLVVLHEDLVADPAPELGHYRIALHEVGHAVDHALDRTVGATHRERVDALFAEDKALLDAGGTNRFLSPRAMDNPREYFAEAVEAYLTVSVGDEHDGFRTEGNHESLRRLRPELYSYLAELLGAARR